MLKVGDKLLCKQSYKLVNSYHDFKKERNKYYTITNIQINVYFDDDWYSLDPNDYWCLWDYFYTPQEVRKLKLKQLMK